MANRYSENLPEVVPDSSPQPLTYAESYDRRGLDQGDQKYTVIYDHDTPKIATSVPIAGDGATPTSPAPAYRAAVAGADGASSAAGNISPDVEDMGKREKALAGSGERKILGMKRRTSFIILIAVVLVIAAAIGGGVGGFHAGKQKASGSDSADVADEAASSPAVTEPSTAHESSVADDESDDEDSTTEDSTTDESANDDTDDDDSSDDDSSDDDSNDDDSSDDESNADSPNTAGSPTKPSPTSSKASPSATPPTSGGGGGGGSDDDKDDDEEEKADDGDDGGDDKPKPGFKFRGWKNANFKGSATDIIATTGFLDLPFDVTSYKWNPEGTDCCVTMCQGKKKDVGWRCTNFEREKSSASFGRIFIGCGAEASQESSRCS